MSKKRFLIQKIFQIKTSKIMKKIMLAIIVLFCLVATVKAQTIPFYGATPSGKIFLIESHADDLGSPGKTIEVSGNWEGKDTWKDWTDMALMQTEDSVGVYIFDSGRSLKGTITLCFRISPNIYFPSAAKDKPKYLISPDDVVSNGHDGYNLKIEVGDFDFK